MGLYLEHGNEYDAPNMELITATQGFASARLGLRTRSLGRGGSLGAEAERANWAGLVLPATMFDCDREVRNDQKPRYT